MLINSSENLSMLFKGVKLFYKFMIIMIMTLSNIMFLKSQKGFKPLRIRHNIILHLTLFKWLFSRVSTYFSCRVEKYANRKCKKLQTSCRPYCQGAEMYYANIVLCCALHFTHTHTVQRYIGSFVKSVNSNLQLSLMQSI